MLKSGLTIKNILVFACACILTVCSFSSSHAAGEIGVIDNGKVLEQYPASQEAQKKIVDARDKLQKTFAGLSAELEKSLQDKNLSEAQKLQKRKDAQDKFEVEKKKVDELVSSLRTDLEGKIIKAINEEAKAQGLQAVIAKNVMFYGGKDITDAVLKRLK